MSQIYRQDPEAASDDLFERGTLGHLLAGNRGRMLDPRRTPVVIVGLDRSAGMFELRVEAFEDCGAHWLLPLEDVVGFQFEIGSRRLGAAEHRSLAQIADRFDRTLELDAAPGAAELTARSLERERATVRAVLESRSALRHIDLERCVSTREGSEQAAAALAELVDAAGLAPLERSLARTYVSNPRSGEVVKGHAIVLAEMGLCAYRGGVVRGQDVFAGDAAREKRRAHVLLRLAFLTELMSLLGTTDVELFRGVAVGAAPERPRSRSLVAATFSEPVAAAHFASPGRGALLMRQRVPASRLLMTFLETRELNERYHEAEAVLIGDPGNELF